ncbi:MAG TPA: hypothetical protein VGF25_15805 [Thermoleophilaceae bacterium]
MPGAAFAADRAVRLTADPSAAACTAFEPLDCSYFMARNGLQPAPDPAAPDAVEPTFINLADLPGDVTIDAVIHDDGTVGVAQGDVTFPAVDTVRPNALVGDVTVNAQIVQAGAWTGTFDEATGAMSLTAPLSLRFKLTCDAVANATCAALAGGNLGTWAVTGKKAAVLTTGHAEAPGPPAEYGPDWVPSDAEDGSPLDPATGALTLVDNTLELEHLDPSDCVDPTSAICNNAALGGIVVVELNNAIGAVWGGAATPENSRDTVPGAIDMSMAFVMEDALIRGTPSVVDFGSQPLGTSSAARGVDLSAFGDTDVELLSLFTSGGDDADFSIASDGCQGTVATAAACTVKVRFNPSDSGNRATGLFAKVRDPHDASKIRTLQIAALSGVGGELPQGPAGPKGDTGPQGPAGPAAPQPPIAQDGGDAARERPSIRRGKSRLRLSSRGTATVATIRCPRGSCRVSSRSARLKIGTRAYKVKVTGSRTIAAGRSAAERVSVGKRVRRALRRRGTGALTVKLVVRSSNGASASRTIRVRLRAR